jgi:hypothetical protein
MARGSVEGVDAAAVRDTVQRALNAMDEVRRIKNTLTGAQTSNQKGKDLVDAMAGRVRANLDDIDALVVTEAGEAPPPPPTDEQDELELD